MHVQFEALDYILASCILTHLNDYLFKQWVQRSFGECGLFNKKSPSFIIIWFNFIEKCEQYYYKKRNKGGFCTIDSSYNLPSKHLVLFVMIFCYGSRWCNPLMIYFDESSICVCVCGVDGQLNVSLLWWNNVFFMGIIYAYND